MTFNSFTDILKEDQNLAVRLAFIDFKIFYTGVLSRIDIINEFDVSEITATRILAEYKNIRSENITYDNKNKIFVLNKNGFKPLFEFSASDALKMLVEGFDKGKVVRGRGFLKNEIIGFVQAPLNKDYVSNITRAIYNKKVVNCRYKSATSDNLNSRVLSPLVILFDGRNWIFRAYDDNANSKVKYKNFNFSRIISVEASNDDIDYENGLDYDSLWNLNLPIELEINPSFNEHKKEELRRDFGIMDGGTKILMTARAAFIWVILNQWMVHYNENEEVNNNYNFCLKNADMLKSFGAITF